MRSRYPASPSNFAYSFGPGRLTPAIKAIVIANVVGFVLGVLVPEITLRLGLVPQAVLEQGALWQPFTYMFLHGGIFHLLFNMLALWMFGVELERMWGSAFFAKYYFVTGLGAAAAQILLGLFPGFGAPLYYGLTIGASGAVYGVGAAVVAAAIRLRGLLSPWRARALIGATMPLLLSSLAGGFARPGTDNAAHIGGALAGALLGAFLPFHVALRPDKESAAARTLWAIAGVVGLSALLSAGLVAFQQGMAGP
jgi:membrane associated rhomboid family serine protease